MLHLPGEGPLQCPGLPLPQQALLGGIESRCSSEGLGAAQRAAAAASLSPSFAPRSGGRRSGGGASGGSVPRRHHTAADYRAAYQAGRLTPSDVAENVIEAVAASEAQVRGQAKGHGGGLMALGTTLPSCR